MAFNPDQYLAETAPAPSSADAPPVAAAPMPATAPAAPGFDPDKYLAETHVGPTNLQTDLRQAAAGATGGFDDELIGGLDAAGRAVGIKHLGSAKHLNELGLEKPTLDFQTLVQAYRAGRDSVRGDKADDMKVNPGRAMAANVAGSLLSPIAKIAPFAGESALAAGGNAATQGAILGFGNSNSDLTKGEVGKAVGDTALGAGVGGVVGTALGAASNALKPEALEDVAESRAAAAMGADKAARKRLGPDAISRIGRQGLDEGIVTPLAGTQDMVDRATALETEGVSGMNNVYSEIDKAGASTFVPHDVAHDLEMKLAPIWRTPINKSEWTQLDNTIESVLARGQTSADAISMSEAQSLKNELQTVGWPLGYKSNPALIGPKQQMAQNAWKVVNDAIDHATQQGAIATGNKALPGLLNRAKDQVAAGKGALGLLANREAKEGNNLISPSDWIAGAGGFAALGPKGLALLAVKKAGDAYGNQTIAYGADKLADIIRSTPQMLGPWAKTLTDALNRSTISLAATNQVLSQTNADYRQHMKALAEQGQK